MQRETHTLAIAHRQYATIYRNAQSLIALLTTFGWVLPRPNLGGWKDAGSFNTHSNGEMEK